MKALLALLVVFAGYYAIRRFLSWLWTNLKYLHQVLEIKLQVSFRPQGDPISPRPDSPKLFQGNYPHDIPSAGNEVREQDLYGLVYHLSGELQSTIREAASGKMPREDLIQALNINLQAYRFLKTSGYRFALDNIVSTTCEKFFAIKLNEEELNRLWKG